MNDDLLDLARRCFECATRHSGIYDYYVASAGDEICKILEANSVKIPPDLDRARQRFYRR